MAAPPFTLHNGPPKRSGHTAAAIIHHYNITKRKPTYYNKKRAWSILGYGTEAQNPPATPVFLDQINNLWNYISADGSGEAEEARAYILDALRRLGYRNRQWHANVPRLTNFLSAALPGAGAVIVNIGDGVSIRNQGPGSGTDELKKSNLAHLWHHEDAPRAGVYELRGARDHFSDVWQRFHRYQGFLAWDDMMQTHYFRTIAVPQGPDSLWHAVSYWRGVSLQHGLAGAGRQNNIWRHWTVKARIWTWFVQTLLDRENPRFREYHILQAMTRTESGAQPGRKHHGELSLLRSLYASRQQGLPAFSAWPGRDNQPPQHINCDAIFHVIADYFCTQVIVFAIDCKATRAGATRIAHDVRQNALPYGYRAYGERFLGPHPPGFNNEAILLVTTDWMNFDAVDFDNSNHAKRGYGVHVNPHVVPPATAVFAPDPVFVRPLPGDWWTRPALWQITIPAAPPATHPLGGPLLNLPPCLQARYNYLPNGLGPTGTADLDEQNNVSGNPSPFPNHYTLSLVNNWNRFEAGIDIPGWAFELPHSDVLADWQNLAGPAAQVGPPTIPLIGNNPAVGLSQAPGWRHPANNPFPHTIIPPGFAPTWEYQIRHGPPPPDPSQPGDAPDRQLYESWVGRLGDTVRIFLEDSDSRYT